MFAKFSPEKKKNLEYIRDHIQAESLKASLPSVQDDNVTLDRYVQDLGALPKTRKMVNLWARVMHGLESTEESAAWFIDYCRRNKGLLAIRSDDSSGGQYMRFQDGTADPVNPSAYKKTTSNESDRRGVNCRGNRQLGEYE